MTKMKRKHLIPVIFLIILALCLGTAYAAGSLDDMSLEELQQLQEELNRRISEKQQQDSQTEQTETAPPEAEAVPIQALKISAPEEPLRSGSEIYLRPLVTVTPAGASKEGLQYTVSDESIAAVTPERKLSGRKAGTVTLTVTDPASGKKASVKIRVVTLITEIRLTPDISELFTGKTLRLTPMILPEDASSKKVTWESKDPGIARVSANGTVTAVAPGRTSIWCYAQDGSSKIGVATVTVKIPMRKIALKSREINLIEGRSAYIDYTVQPADATEPYIEWVSSDPSVAEAGRLGAVTAKSAGTCIITATALDGSGVTAKITVHVDPIRPMHIEMLHYKNARFGRSFCLDAVSDCTYRKIAGFNYDIRCYSPGDTIPTVSAYYFDRRLDPGKKAATKWTGGSTPGFDTASRVVIIVTDVFFTDGTSCTIPENQRVEAGFTFD